VTALEEAIRDTAGCVLVIIDPISAYLGGVDTHNNAEVRTALARLKTVAEKYGVAIVAVSHLNKSDGSNAKYRVSGSLAFVAAARAVWAVAADSDRPDRRLMVNTKGNLTKDKSGLAYSIAEGPDGQPVIEWEPDPIELRAEDVLVDFDDDAKSAPALTEAKDWLLAELADGPVRASELYERAKADHIAARTLRRAKNALGVKTKKLGKADGWAWFIPEGNQHPPCPETVAPFDDVGPLREKPPGDAVPVDDDAPPDPEDGEGGQAPRAGGDADTDAGDAP
jgi:hypothetical protein